MVLAAARALQYSVSVQLGVSLLSATYENMGEEAVIVRATKYLRGRMSFCHVAIPSARGGWRWLALVLILQSSLWTTLAGAQSSASAIKEFGLLGTWADDCSAMPSPANQYAIFSLTSRGNIELRNDFGPDYDQMVYRIVDVRRLSHFRLALRQLLTTNDQILLNTIMMKANERIRVWSSRGSDGSILVEDGVIAAADGQETGWMVRCDVRRTDNPESGSERPAFERFRKSGSLVFETSIARGERRYR
jgi:hypothetical protein